MLGKEIVCFPAINFGHLSEEAGHAYLDKRREAQGTSSTHHFYIGAEQFRRFVEKGALGIGDIVRIYDTRGRTIDQHFILVPEGLVDTQDEKFTAYTPEQVFDKQYEGEKDGKLPWSIEENYAIFESVSK